MLFGSTQPAYSMGLSPRKLHSTQLTPGPADYSPITLAKKKPRTIFGSSTNRGHFSKSMSPGPGSYTVDTVALGKGPKAVISGRYQTKQGNESPGPGAYHHQNADSPLRYSFGSAPRMPEISGTSPGPAAYQVAGNTLKRPAVTKFPKAMRDSPGRRSLPGPGDYLPAPPQSSTGFTFSKAYTRAVDGKAETPGPGSYCNPMRSTFNAGGVSLVSRRNLSTGFEGHPGPGHYDLTASFEGPAYSVGRSGRDLPNRSETPSPNRYDPRPVLTRLPEVKIGTSRRIDPTNATRPIPGPANYSPTQPNKQLPVSFKFRLVDTEFEERKRMPVGSK